MGVLNLDPRIHLDEDVLTRTLSFGFDQELHSSRTGIVDRLGEAHRVMAQGVTQLGRNARSWRDLNELLVPSLDRAVALEQMNGVPLGVSEDLYLDVPAAANGLLNERRRVAECSLCLTHGRRHGLPERLGIFDPTHAAAAATGNRFDEHGKANLFGSGHQLIEGPPTVAWTWGGDPSRLGRPNSAHLVAGVLEGPGGGTTEDDAGLGARPLPARDSRSRTRTGVDRIGPGLSGGPDDLGDIQVCTDRMPALADHVGLIRFDPVTALRSSWGNTATV